MNRIENTFASATLLLLLFQVRESHDDQAASSLSILDNNSNGDTLLLMPTVQASVLPAAGHVRISPHANGISYPMGMA